MHLPYRPDPDSHGFAFELSYAERIVVEDTATGGWIHLTQRAPSKEPWDFSIVFPWVFTRSGNLSFGARIAREALQRVSLPKKVFLTPTQAKRVIDWIVGERRSAGVRGSQGGFRYAVSMSPSPVSTEPALVSSDASQDGEETEV